MDIKPKLTITGYRGIWGKDLDEGVAFEYARAFARFIKRKGGKKILVGRDARKTGDKIFLASQSAISKEGLDPVYANIIPTPSMLFLTQRLSYDGGIMITASHNPPDYNGLKFILGEGRLTNENEKNEIENIRLGLTQEDKIYKKEEGQKEERPDNSEFRKLHIQAVLDNVDTELIRKKKFKVALDPINSAGSEIGQELLRELGCEVHVINSEMNGNFAHTPEPLRENLLETEKRFAEIAPDVGFIQDPDADRLVLADESGGIILEELSVSLAIKSVLSRNIDMKHENVVVNLSTTRVCDDICKEYGANLFRTKVGEANVVGKMIETEAIIGGEGSGGIIYPGVGFFRDSLSGMALILELMARENKKISEIVKGLPKYIMKKEKFPLNFEVEKVYKLLKEKFPEASYNELDGLRLDWPDQSWVHIRPSNTEPILRIFGESSKDSRIQEIFEEINLTLALK